MYYGAFYKINVYLTHWLYWIHRWPLLLFNIDILCRIPCVHIHNSYIRREENVVRESKPHSAAFLHNQALSLLSREALLAFSSVSYYHMTIDFIY